MVRRRRRIRRVKYTTVVVGVLALMAAASYGLVRGVLFAQHLWDEHHRHLASASTTAPPITTTTVPGPPACAPSQLAVYLSHWEITGGTLYEIVVVDETAGTPCSLSGYVDLSVTELNGGAISVPVHDDPTLGASAGASTTPVMMGSGQPAWFEVSYPVQCSTVLAPGQTPTGAPGQCYEGQALGVIVPRSTTPLSVPQPLSFTFGTTGFDVGPFGAGGPPNPPPVSE